MASVEPERTFSWYPWVRPLLFALEAEAAHHLGMWTLGLADLCPAVARQLRQNALSEACPVTVAGIHFPSAVGLAAGLDKNAECLIGLFALGFGFVEVGTVTPLAQPGNDTPRLFRIPSHQALINRFGFNNHGAAAMSARLRELEWKPAPVGVNIGKNKDTPNEAAEDDYLKCTHALESNSDYLVVNLSSPNTPGLRSLQSAAPLRRLLTAIRRATLKPLFVKLSPDLDDHALDEAVDVSLECALDGFVCTNTTLARPFQSRHSEQAGGLSGAPVRERATEVIRRVFRRTQGTLPIIGVGGIFDAQHAWQKISAGAALVQVYSGLVYQGPGLPAQLNRGLKQHLRASGCPDLASAVGRDA